MTARETRRNVDIAGWDPPLDRVVGSKIAASFIGVDATRLREAIRRGFIEVTEWRDHGGGRRAAYAPLRNWMEGWQRWEAHQRRDWFSATQAARKLGIPVSVARKLVTLRYVNGERTSEGLKAPIEAWREALERYRREHPQAKGMERRRKKGAPNVALRTLAGPEEVARRVRELRQRETAFRVFVLAVKKGLPMGNGFFARLWEAEVMNGAAAQGADGEAAARPV